MSFKLRLKYSIIPNMCYINVLSQHIIYNDFASNNKLYIVDYKAIKPMIRMNSDLYLGKYRPLKVSMNTLSDI